ELQWFSRILFETMPAHMANRSCFLLFLCLICCCDGTCPNMCLCLSDTVSCSSTGLTKLPAVLPTFSIILDLSHNYLSYLGAGSFEKTPRLENLCLAHNQLTSLGEGVFQNASGLRFLDLSSNKLHLVEQHYFHGLWRLEELLLYNNKITQVESGMLNKMSSLKKLYLNDHRCSIYGEMRASIKFLHHTRFFHNCTLEKAVSLPVTVYLSTVLVTEEETISLDCQTALKSTENCSDKSSFCYIQIIFNFTLSKYTIFFSMNKTVNTTESCAQWCCTQKNAPYLHISVMFCSSVNYSEQIALM
uniref:LRRNT domain-containing protein n=1 Tax=Periophthalmus magnuspinnatus TaxID=409849 RepID=A0A3B4A3F3_9GOBI